MGYIKGQCRSQILLLPEALDDYITEENPVRVIDAYVDSLNLSEHGIKAEPAETGRPPYNPQDMLKLYIYGYFNKLRSSRRLEAETHRNMELIWLMSKLTPDHKTIARFRKENAKALKNIFHSFVKLCRKLGLYGCELIAIDGSKFKAVNSLENNYNHEKLDDRLKRIDEKLEEYFSELDANDDIEAAVRKNTKSEIEAAISELSARKETYEGLKVRLDETNQTQISTIDPDARRMKQADGSSDVCYNVQTAVDAKNKMIVDYNVTNNCNDKNLLSPMVASAKEVLEVEGITALADTGFFVATDIAECITNGDTVHVSNEHESITMCIPVLPEEAAEAVKPQDFENTGKNVFIKERNLGLCPMGAVLYPVSYRKSKGAAIYSNRKACKDCPHRENCKEYDRELQVKMHPDDFTKEYNDKNLGIKQIIYSPDRTLLPKRKELVEHPFGTLKRSMDSAYCLLKGIKNVCGEFALSFLVYNLKRAINILGINGLLKGIKLFA